MDFFHFAVVRQIKSNVFAFRWRFRRISDVNEINLYALNPTLEIRIYSNFSSSVKVLCDDCRLLVKVW